MWVKLSGGRYVNLANVKTVEFGERIPKGPWYDFPPLVFSAAVEFVGDSSHDEPTLFYREDARALQAALDQQAFVLRQFHGQET